MFFEIVPAIRGAVPILVKIQGSIYTINGKSAVIDGQSLLVALRIKSDEPTGSFTVAITVITIPTTVM